MYDLFIEVKENKLEEIKKQEKDEKTYDYLKERINSRFEEQVGTRFNWYEPNFYKLSDAVNSKKELDEKKLKEIIMDVCPSVESITFWQGNIIIRIRDENI